MTETNGLDMGACGQNPCHFYCLSSNRKTAPLLFGFCILKHLCPLVWMSCYSIIRFTQSHMAGLCHAGGFSLGVQGGQILLEHECQGMPQHWKTSCPVNHPTLPAYCCLLSNPPFMGLPCLESKRNLEIPGKKTCVRQGGERLGSIPPSGGGKVSPEVAAPKSRASGRMCAARRIG